LLLKEGDMIRVFFTFFAPPTYCRTKSFILLAPNVSVAEEAKPTTPSEPSTPSSSSNDDAKSANYTMNGMDDDYSGALERKSFESRLSMGRVLPGQFRGYDSAYGPRTRYGPRDRRSAGGSRRSGRGYERDDDDDNNEYDQQDGDGNDQPRHHRRGGGGGGGGVGRDYGRSGYGRQREEDDTNSDTNEEVNVSPKVRSKEWSSSALSSEDEELNCEQIANFMPRLTKIKGLTNSLDDQNNYAINFKASKANRDNIYWVDVHYQKNDDVQRNYRMEQLACNDNFPSLPSSFL
jgi:hypothetical protein